MTIDIKPEIKITPNSTFQIFQVLTKSESNQNHKSKILNNQSIHADTLLNFYDKIIQFILGNYPGTVQQLLPDIAVTYQFPVKKEF